MIKRVAWMGMLLLALAGCNSSQRSGIDKKVLQESMQRVADWQIANFNYIEEGNLHDYGIDAWTNGVLYIGMMEYARSVKDTKYLQWLKDDIGEKNNWKVPANFLHHPKYSIYHSDELCISQFYLEMYRETGEEKIIESTLDRIHQIMEFPPDTAMNYRNKQSWSWCDALFMAPPVYAQLYSLTNKENYLTFMDYHFKRTYDHLYDKDAHLFYRDDSYFDKREQNGEKIFWGRGNGWVIAGIANLLKELPQESPIRGFYEDLFRELAAELVRLQDEGGYWHASLLDPESYPAPEASATALITYGLTYGVNNGLLEQKDYLGAIDAAWEWMLSAVNEEGKLGWVQPIGADPKKVTSDMTAVYGVGAFLLAGTEMVKMLN